MSFGKGPVSPGGLTVLDGGVLRVSQPLRYRCRHGPAGDFIFSKAFSAWIAFCSRSPHPTPSFSFIDVWTSLPWYSIASGSIERHGEFLGYESLFAGRIEMAGAFGGPPLNKDTASIWWFFSTPLGRLRDFFLFQLVYLSQQVLDRGNPESGRHSRPALRAAPLFVVGFPYKTGFLF